MKFIHFGCWNNGRCEIKSNNTPVSTVIKSIKDNEDLKEYNFISVAGDNYYPKKNKKEGYKTHIFSDLESGFKCLNELKDIRKFILLGNHEYNDVYSNHIIGNEYFSENTYCVNLKTQKKLLNDTSYYKDFILFNNVIQQYDIINHTLVIMIDTTIYEDSKKIIIECYDEVFGNKEDTEYLKITNKEDKINYISNKQLTQVKDILNNKRRKLEKIIFIGHHPIFECRSKKGNIITKLDKLYDFFENIKDLISTKKVLYLCADTHFYQKGIVTINDDFKIEQHIVGTGGALCDKICTEGASNNNYKVEEQIQEYGYLTYNNGLINFKLIKFDGDNSCSDSSKRKYRVHY